MSLPFTSIIITVDNTREQLEACVRSIQAFTDGPFEIIVIDNGSNDGTDEYCRQKRITFASLPQARSHPTACNIGLKLAKGKALLLLNSCAIATPNWLSNMLHCLYSDSRNAGVAPDINTISQMYRLKTSYEIIEGLIGAASKYNHRNPAKWRQIEHIAGDCFLFKRELLQRIGYLEEPPEFGTNQWDDYCIRAIQAGYRLMSAGDVIIYRQDIPGFSAKGSALA